MKPAIVVRRPADLSVTWAQKIVEVHHAGTSVAKVDVVAVDVGTTTRVSVDVDHNGPESLPSRWFVKFPSLSRRARAITALPRLLPTEVRFYNEVAQQVPLNLPVCLAACSRFGSGATLVLADVAEFDSVAGKAGESLSYEQAVLVVEQLALSHARHWHKAQNDPNFRWLAGPVRAMEDFFGSVLAVPLMRRGLQLAGSDVAAALHLPAIHYARHRRSVMRFLTDAPQTLVHHDCHPGNLFWNRDRTAVGFLDWQMVRLGEGIGDVAYFLGTALSPEVRKRHESDLLFKYIDALAMHGVTVSDPAELKQRYRAHLVYAFEAMVLTLAVGGLMQLEGNLEMIRRTAAAVDDLDAFCALPI